MNNLTKDYLLENGFSETFDLTKFIDNENKLSVTYIGGEWLLKREDISNAEEIIIHNIIFLKDKLIEIKAEKEFIKLFKSK